MLFDRLQAYISAMSDREQVHLALLIILAVVFAALAQLAARRNAFLFGTCRTCGKTSFLHWICRRGRL